MIHRIPVNKLSPEALQGVIEEYISRDGTDYDEIEVPMETKFRYVKQKLEKELAVLMHKNSRCHVCLDSNLPLRPIQSPEHTLPESYCEQLNP